MNFKFARVYCTMKFLVVLEHNIGFTHIKIFTLEMRELLLLKYLYHGHFLMGGIYLIENSEK